MNARRALPVLLVLAVVAVVLTAIGVLAADGGHPAEGAGPSARPEPIRSSPRAVLASWDAARARAWARGDVAALRGLYVPGSSAARRDVAALRAWVDRGLRATDWHVQVLRLDVAQESDERLDLVVTDRVVGGVATGSAQRRRLPVDRPSTRRVVLRRADGVWRVAHVRDQDSPAESTASTSASSKE